MTDRSVRLIRHIRLRGFRNYEDCAVDFDNRRVLVYGANGSGKSNLLEALYYLLTLRSFRTFQLRELIGIGAADFRLEAVLDGKLFPVRIGCGLNRELRRGLMRDGNPLRRGSEFVNLCKVVAFAPEDLLICSGGSMLRRRFFDMLICGLESEYFTALRDYHAALRERNALLKMTDDPSQMTDAFEDIMAENTVVIRHFREQYAKMTEQVTDQYARRSGHTFAIRCRTDGIPNTKTACLEKLRRDRARDRLRKSTSSGPQSDEFDLMLDGKLMKSFASNGQLRLLSLYLKMAELELVSSRNVDQLPLVALVDDVTGELDEKNRLFFLNALEKADQMFFTFAVPVADKWFDGAEILTIKDGSVVVSA